MAKVAFELRADSEDFSGGSTSLPGGEAFNVGDALQAGNGKINLNPDPGDRKEAEAQEKENRRAARDARIVEALDKFPALKRTSADAAPAKDEKKGAGS